MGWLRDLMLAATPPIRSFGELAREALGSKDWPSELDIQPRSLATLFSKLDREEQLSWLADRPSVQDVLARLCSVPPDALHRAVIRTSSSAASEGILLRLNDVPGARPLDLVRERLPPGIPERVQRIDAAPVWWVAPSGTGRSLCGQWLKARGRAAFVMGSGWESVQQALPDGPVFVELLGARGAPVARPGLCIAAPFEPTTPGFERVTSPPLHKTLDDLSEWLLARLPADTRLAHAQAREFLLERLEEGLVCTLGDALGWLGLLDELEARELKRPLDRLLRRFVERRVVATTDPASAHAGWIRRTIFALLVGLVERTFTDSDRPLEAERSQEDWMALVPPEVERSVDVEWMRLSLSRIETAVRPSDLDRAARQLPPGAFRVVTALERGGLLVGGTDTDLRLGPCWLRTALARQATRSLIERSPFEWGEAILHEHAAPRIAGALFERTLEVGGSVLEPVLDLDAEDQPAYAAAADVAFRAGSIARLLGADVSLEVLDGLLSETARLALDLPPGLPIPRIDLLGPGADESASSRFGAPLLRSGAFYLSVLSATEVASTRAARLKPLDPWHETRPSPVLTRAYDAILELVKSVPEWQTAAFGLVMRARSVIGNAGDPEIPHPLERPAQILDEVQHGVLDWNTIGDFGDEWLVPLFALAPARHVSSPALARAIWTAWDEALRPEGARFLAPSAPHHELFWKHVPETLLEGLLTDARRHHVPYGLFGAEQWRAFSRAVSNNPELVGDVAAFAHMPRELAFSLLRSELPWDKASASLAELWTRFPEELRTAVRERILAGNVADSEGLTMLLRAVPKDEAAKLVAELGVEPVPRGISPVAVVPLRVLLHGLISERAPSWRAAYGLLSDLERELRRVALD